MAAAYEQFLKRIQEGLKKEEEEEKKRAAEAAQETSGAPPPSYCPPPLQNQNAEPPPASPSPTPDDLELPSLGDVDQSSSPTKDPEQEELPPIMLFSLKDVYESICHQIRAANMLDDFMQDFQTCKTDIDRVSYVAQLTELENLILEENYSTKSHDDADNYENVYDMLISNEANAAKALDVMKNCIQKTPIDDTKSLAIRYRKRGWAFLLLEQFVHAAADAKQSLSYDYPEENLWNAYEILGHAYSHQTVYNQAESYFLKALENLRKSNAANEVKASATVRIMTVFKTIKGKKGKKNFRSNEESIDIPKVSYGCHKSFPSASSALDFITTRDRNRCVIAKREIKPGDVLMVDTPYCSMLNPEYLGTHCYYCYMRAPAPIPCSSCAKIRYCSEKCREASWNSLHAGECKVFDHLTDSGIGKMALLSFRILVKLKWPELREIREKIESLVEDEVNEIPPDLQEYTSEPHAPMPWEGQYSPQDYMTVYKLAHNSTKRSFGDLFKRAITAVYLAKCLVLSGYFDSKEPSDDDFLFVASVLLRHLQGCSCNAYEVSEFELVNHTVVGATVNEVGGALYTTISLTNHACFSNVTRYNIGDICVLRAIRPIPKGGEILDNYGFHYYLDAVNERQEILSNQYKFTCKCKACTDIWALYPHHPKESLLFFCPECHQVCGYSSANRFKCDMCGNQQPYARLIKEMESQMIRYKDGLQKIKDADADSAYPVLSMHMEFLDRHAALPMKHYSDLQEAIKQCFYCLGNCHKPSRPKPQEQPRQIEQQPNQQTPVKMMKKGKKKFVNPNR